MQGQQGVGCVSGFVSVDAIEGPYFVVCVVWGLVLTGACHHVTLHSIAAVGPPPQMLAAAPAAPLTQPNTTAALSFITVVGPPPAANARSCPTIGAQLSRSNGA